MAEKLGILLTTSPENQNTQTVLQITRAALAQGKEVRIFLMCDGVHNLHHPGFISLLGQGAKVQGLTPEVAVCALSAEQRAIQEQKSVTWGSQYDLATLVSEVDRFLAFN